MSETTKGESLLKNAPEEQTAKESEAKFRRIVVAFTVGAVILLSVLVILMCYQLIEIGGKNRQKAELQSAIAELKEQSDADERIIETMQKRWYIEQRARELGYRYTDDN